MQNSNINKVKYLLMLIFVLVLGCNSNNEQLFNEISKEEFREKAKELLYAWHEVYGEPPIYSRDIFFKRNKNLIFLSLEDERNIKEEMRKIKNYFIFIDSYFKVSRNYISHNIQFIDNEYTYFLELMYPKKKSVLDEEITENNYLKYVNDNEFKYLLFKETIEDYINFYKSYISDNPDTSKYSIAWNSHKRIKEIKEAQKEYIEKYGK